MVSSSAARDFKANFDGTWFNQSEEGRIGIVVKDSTGQVPAALVEKKKKTLILLIVWR